MDNTPHNSLASGTWNLIVFTLLHFLVDTVAGQMSPLWPALKQHYLLGEGGTFWLLLIWTMATSFSQLGFGLLGDSTVGRKLVWLGPVVGAICLGCVGLSTSPIVLCTLLICGGLGIAAFHPEGATLAGNSWPTARSRSISIFAMGGFLGQAAGPYCSGLIVDRFGLSGLSGGIAVALALILSLRFAFRETPSVPRSQAFDAVHEAVQVLRKHYVLVSLLVLSGTLRVVAASGIPVALSYWLAAKDFPKSEVGLVQSCFMAGIGLGGLASALFVKPRTEQFALWLIPTISVPFIALIPQLEGLALKGATGVSGLLIGIALPVFISYGQQLLPESQRVASSLTMGVSWGTGGAIVAALIDQCDRHQQFDFAFVGFSLTVIASSLLGLLLPRVAHKTSIDESKS